MKLGFHGHVEEAYLRFMDKKLKERRAALGVNPLLRDIYLKVPSKEAKSGAPLSPILSPYGLNVNDFVTQFNGRTSDGLYGTGVKIPTIVNVFENKSTKFFFTTLYSFFIISNNSNKYRFYRLKELYKRFLVIQKSINIGQKRKWSKIDMLYKKMPISTLYNSINSNRFFINKKHVLVRKKKYKKEELKLSIMGDIDHFKVILSTIKGTKSLVFVNLSQLIKGGFFKLASISTLSVKNHEFFISLFEKEFLSRNMCLNKRLFKLLIKFKLNYYK